MVARVAIDLALDRLFDYAIPNELAGKLAVGQLLRVPFGHREARGFLMEFAVRSVQCAVDDAGRADGENGSVEERELFPAANADANRGPQTANRTLKKILGIADEVPFFSEKLLELVRRVAEWTMSPIESVLRAAVPAAVLRPGAKERLEFFVSPIEGKTGDGLSERQKWLYDQIVRVGGGWMRSLADEMKTTADTLRKLEAAGMVSIERVARRRNPLANRRILPSRNLALNAGQAAALEAISTATRPLLLHGVTGSGKTEVYLQAIERELAAGRGAIVMVPEIALTPQTVQRFASRFGDRVAVLHSALSDGERFDEWHRIRSGKASVVVGPRSAVFAPVKSLGLIVVDEEHETSYKQDSQPRYNARDVAVMRAAIEGAKVVLGSATPSLESWRNAQTGKYALATLSERAGAGTMPLVHVIDMAEERERGIFSAPLLDALRLRLARGEQSMLFLNRRGYSRSVTCEGCGEPVMCPDCSMPYTYHRADDCLRCHICGSWRPVPKACPSCGSEALSFKGIGTQRAEAALGKCLPGAKVLRMDADSTSRRHSHDDILGAFRRGEAQILLGTQMIAKGLDFPNVTLVGVLNADSSLNMPDFRAAERTFQLLAQVSGRAGRAELPGEVFIQTYSPDEPAIATAARGDFATFARDELAAREQAWFPPFCRLAAICLSARDPKTVGDWATMYAQSLSAYAKGVGGLVAGDAYPSALEKAEGWFRWQIVMRSRSAAAMRQAWRWLTGVRPPPKCLRVVIDMDAFGLV